MWPEEIKEEWKRTPAGNLICVVEEVKREMQTVNRQSGQVSVLTERVTLMVMEPSAYEGITFDEIFYIGSDSDPEAKLAETLSRGGASKFQTFARAAQVEIAGKDEEVVHSELKDRRVGVTIMHKVKADGKIRANATAWWTEGERLSGVDEAAMAMAVEKANVLITSGGPRTAPGIPPRMQGTAPLPPPRAAGAAPLPGRVGR